MCTGPDTASLQKGKTSTTSVLDMTLNNLMVVSGVVASDRVLVIGQIELNCTYAKLNCLK